MTVKLSLDTSPDDLELLSADLTEVLSGIEEVTFESGDYPLCVVTGFDEVGINVEMRFKVPAKLSALDFLLVKSRFHIGMLRRLTSRGIKLASAQRIQVLNQGQ